MNAPTPKETSQGVFTEERLTVILEYLRENAALGDFPALVKRIRGGDGKAIPEYTNCTLILTNPETWSRWTGPESPDAICRYLNSIVNQAQSVGTPPPPQTPAPPPSQPLPSPVMPPPDHGTASVAQIVDGLLSAAGAQRATTPQASPESPEHKNGVTPTSDTVPWRNLARAAGFEITRLTPAAIELLDMLARVLIKGKGWGKHDPLRGIRLTVTLSPSRMSEHGQGRDRRTYQRQYTRLVALGLLLELRREPGGACVVAPAWWESHYAKDGLGVWREAARRIACGDDCRSNAAAVPQVDPQIAAPLPHPPVPARRPPSCHDENGLPSYPLRHSKGRLDGL